MNLRRCFRQTHSVPDEFDLAKFRVGHRHDHRHGRNLRVLEQLLEIVDGAGRNVRLIKSSKPVISSTGPKDPVELVAQGVVIPDAYFPIPETGVIVQLHTADGV